MVAIKGPDWVLAPSLIRLMNETDLRFPDRATVSDGSIGDYAHSIRPSDHNPDEGWVDAVDITDDDTHGCDISVLFAHLTATKDPRVLYLIHNAQITKSYASNGYEAWEPQPYNGPNAHKLHGHVSIKDSGRLSTRTWWPIQQEDEEVTPEDINKIADAVIAKMNAKKNGVAGAYLDPAWNRMQSILEQPDVDANQGLISKIWGKVR